MESGSEAPPKPLVLAKLAHSKSNDDHKIVAMQQTSRTIVGKRRSTYQMKVSNYDLDYVGESVARDHCGSEWIAALVNRRTGKTTFASVEMVSFHAKQPNSDNDTTEKVESFEEARRKLIMEFGHKKKKQALTSSLRNAIDAKAGDQLFAHAMNYMQEQDAKRPKLDDQPLDAESPQADVPNKRTSVSSVLPPCNLQAKSPAEIYDIKDIVSDEILDALKPEAERLLLMAPAEFKQEGHSPLVSAIISMSSTITDIDQRTARVAYCLYLSCLLRLNVMIGGGARFVVPSALYEGTFSWIPQVVITDLLDKFTSVGSGGVQTSSRSWRNTAKLNVTAAHKDSLLARVAVLLLILSDQYAFNVNKAFKDLGGDKRKASLAKLSSICKALGCRLEKHKQSGEQLCFLERPPREKNALLKKQGFGSRGGRR